MNLLVKGASNQRDAITVTPESAGWRHVGFEVKRLLPGERILVCKPDREMCLVVLSGMVSVTAGEQQWHEIGKRSSVFDEHSPYAVYIPPRLQVDVLAHNPVELWLERVPVFTMYVSGVGYGLAFIGVGYSFNVLASSSPNPLLGVPNNLVGGISLVVLIPSILVLLAGKSVAIAAGRLKEGSVLGSLANGGLEVFERISQFMSNTISYIRLAVMLLVHAGLLLITNEYFAPWNNPLYTPIWIILNLLIVGFEAMIVYIQDLRLHLYEFFTKFYRGTGKPFTRIFPDKPRVSIEWH